MSHVLEVSQLSKSYRQGDTEIQVLRGLHFSVLPNEKVAILGPSGSGKSTLLSMIAGLDQPDGGYVSVNSQKLSQLSNAQLANFRARNIGIVFQQFHLLPQLTAIENVALPAEILGWTSEKAYQRAQELLQGVGLIERSSHKPHQLSGGECQRVAIARSLITQPALLLADEPSGNLDQSTGEKVMSLLFELVSRANSSLVLVTHNEELAKKCDRIVRLTRGVLA